jgi:hypothetical protein
VAWWLTKSLTWFAGSRAKSVGVGRGKAGSLLRCGLKASITDLTGGDQRREKRPRSGWEILRHQRPQRCKSRHDQARHAACCIVRNPEPQRALGPTRQGVYSPPINATYRHSYGGPLVPFSCLSDESSPEKPSLLRAAKRLQGSAQRNLRTNSVTLRPVSESLQPTQPSQR